MRRGKSYASLWKKLHHKIKFAMEENRERHTYHLPNGKYIILKSKSAFFSEYPRERHCAGRVNSVNVCFVIHPLGGG